MHIFKDFNKNHRNKGVCQANIGSIMFQKGDLKAARRYYEAAIKNLKKNKPAQHMFLLACRQFQLGMVAL